MDAFGYLSVLLSIILGLAMTQVLQGYRALLLARGRVVGGAVPLLWSALLLLFATQAWWASFGLRDHADWSFGAFAVVLLQMTLLYMMAAVVLPDVPAEGPVDLGDHHTRHRVIFFGLLLSIVGVSLIKDVVLNGSLPGRGNLIFHATLALTALLGMSLAGSRSQLALAVVTGIGFAIYVTVLFARL